MTKKQINRIVSLSVIGLGLVSCIYVHKLFGWWDSLWSLTLVAQAFVLSAMVLALRIGRLSITINFRALLEERNRTRPTFDLGMRELKLKWNAPTICYNVFALTVVAFFIVVVGNILLSTKNVRWLFLGDIVSGSFYFLMIILFFCRVSRRTQ